MTRYEAAQRRYDRACKNSAEILSTDSPACLRAKWAGEEVGNARRELLALGGAAQPATTANHRETDMDRSDTAHDRTLACVESEAGQGMLWLYRDEADARHVADVEYRDFPGRRRPPVLARKIRAGGLTITLWVVVLDWRERPVSSDDGSCSFGMQ